MDRRLPFECVVTLWSAAKAACARLDGLEWLTEMAGAVRVSTTTRGRALCASKGGGMLADTTATATGDTASAITWKAHGVRTYPAHDENMM
ncbi:hypothetical protein GA0061083_2862 [Pseudarthrobacter enclensis]|nr:hypothetical protein GA0061083_2862 [Pseudarthrobacter enclensis]